MKIFLPDAKVYILVKCDWKNTLLIIISHLENVKDATKEILRWSLIHKENVVWATLFCLI